LGELALGKLDWKNLHWANLYWAKDHGIFFDNLQTQSSNFVPFSLKSAQKHQLSVVNWHFSGENWKNLNVWPRKS